MLESGESLYVYYYGTQVIIEIIGERKLEDVQIAYAIDKAKKLVYRNDSSNAIYNMVAKKTKNGTAYILYALEK